MILLFTDFGLDGPYVGQMHAALLREAPPGTPVVDLMHDAPAFDPRASAYLLAALWPYVDPGSVLVAVVDPGVGTERRAVALKADDRWLVGPDNGLLEVVVGRARELEWWDLTWRPERLSHSFHGRDLFAPVAAHIADGQPPPGVRRDPAERLRGWADDLAEVIYLDGFGNAMTGLRAAAVAPGALLTLAKVSIPYAHTFGAVAPGQAFWYENSLGLVEIAVNRGSAARALSLRIGTPFRVG